jgi:hypothetical protein
MGSAIADNMALGGLAAPVDLTTGKICGPAIRIVPRKLPSELASHPDTGVGLEGFQIPCWEEVKALATLAQINFPDMAFVGWDIAILPDGPIVLEGNAWWDIDLNLLPHGISLIETPFIPYYNFHLDVATNGCSGTIGVRV